MVQKLLGFRPSRPERPQPGPVLPPVGPPRSLAPILPQGSVTLPPGVTLPKGVTLPPGYGLPPGLDLPPGLGLPPSFGLPPGVTVPVDPFTAPFLQNVKVGKDAAACKVLSVRERIFNKTFKKQFINKEIGYGLVATKEIAAGTALFGDKLITVWSNEHKACKTLSQANVMLARKARAMGPEWYTEFMKLPCTGEAEIGRMGAIWDAHHMPAAWNGKAGGVLGLTLAWANHSCVPNCTLSFVTRYPTNKDGEVLWDRPPRLVKALVRACVDISPGQELTISYSLTRGAVKERQAEIYRQFGFKCACRVCQVPHCYVENTLYAFHRLEDTLNDKYIIADKPALAFHIAHDLIAQLLRSRVHDMRVSMMWVKCALIAAHHSDLARAHCFLARARQIALILEGPGGFFYRQVSNWYVSPTLMPGYGGTLRGLSAPNDAWHIFQNQRDSRQVLFMIGCAATEYIRVSRYRRIRSKTPIPPERPKYEVRPGLDPAPPRIDAKSKKPYKPCCGRNGCRVEERIEKIQRERRKKEIRMAAKKAAFKANGGCINPEKDFLDLFLEVVNDFENPNAGLSEEEDIGEPGEAVHEQWKKGKQVANMGEKEGKGGAELESTNPNEVAQESSKKRKRNARKNKKKAAAHGQPVLKDVEAEKKVVVVNTEDDIGEGEQAEGHS